MPRVLTLEKSILLLESVFLSTDGIGTRALAVKLGLNVATTHNIATTFCSKGYLSQDPISKLFFPGRRLMLLGRHPSYKVDQSFPGLELVDNLADTFRENVKFSLIDRLEIHCLRSAVGQQVLRVQELGEDSIHPHCSAIGKIMLSALWPEDLERFLAAKCLARLTPRTIDDAGVLKQELRQTLRQGYAVAADEWCDGVTTVAVPVEDPWGKVFAALGVSAPSVRMQRQGSMERIVRELRIVAGKLSLCGRTWRGARGTLRWRSDKATETGVSIKPEQAVMI